MNIDQERTIRGDEIDIKSVSNLFSDFIPDKSYKLILMTPPKEKEKHRHHT